MTKYFITVNTYIAITITCWLISLSAALATNTTASVDYSTAKKLLQAVSQVQLNQQKTHSLLLYCGQQFKHLSTSANKAQKHWQQQNQTAIQQSSNVKNHITAQLQQHSPLAADKLMLEMDALVRQGVTQFKQYLAEQTQKQRHYLCNRLILSVQAGEWDLKTQIPQALETLRKGK